MHQALPRTAAGFGPSPSEGYQTRLAEPGFMADPAQAEALAALEALYQQLAAGQAPCQGLYLWGDVGRGKTLLMDLFQASLPHGLALRLHFHRFMARIHRELMLAAGQVDPLKAVAAKLAGECRVLCFDECFVNDIADAMLLGGLFQALFDEGLVLVATSNIPIARLYENGLQRQRFEPFLALLASRVQTLHLAGAQDHRLRHTPYRQTCFVEGEADFAALFQQLAQAPGSDTPLTVCNRPLPVIRASAQVAWFHFDDLCGGPRSQLDYVALAGRFKTRMVSSVPVLGGVPRGWIRARGTEDGIEAVAAGDRVLAYAEGDDPARRFIALVDELYDQGVHLYLSCALAPEQLYQGQALAFEFRRTRSRLVEMQSRDYLAP